MPPVFCRRLKFIVMPIISFEKILKIILTILNVLSAALRAFNFEIPSEDDNLDGLS